jgi:MoxR-like ATPase
MARNLRPEELDNLFKAEFNVLLRGKHGVGKTAMIKSCFERMGLVRNESYLYFSTPTMDPWTDLVGVPKAITDKNNNQYLDFIRPKNLIDGKIVAIFFDEYNRSAAKVRNAIMELMQFKSINGFKFPNLKVVWAAINPATEEETYDVQRTDPAQEDRYHTLPIDVPYECSREYFVEKYGYHNANAAIEWWNALPADVKDAVSPRRLDYALTANSKDIALDLILPASSNINKLVQALRIGPIQDKLVAFLKEKDVSGARLFLANNNNLTASTKFVLENQEMMSFFLPLFPKEQLASLIYKNDKVCSFVSNNAASVSVYNELMSEIMRSKDPGHKDLQKKLRDQWGNAMTKSLISDLSPSVGDYTPAEPYFNPSATKAGLAELSSIYDFSTTTSRDSAFNKVKNLICKDMSKDDSIQILNVINKIMKDSFASTLLSPKYEHLSGVINHCLVILRDEGELDPKQGHLLDCLVNLVPAFSMMRTKLKTTNKLVEIVRS